MGYRQFGPAEIWDTVREWLEKQGVEAPLRVPPTISDSDR